VPAQVRQPPDDEPEQGEAPDDEDANPGTRAAEDVHRYQDHKQCQDAGRQTAAPADPAGRDI
jgi:hypothetical protein